MKKILSGKVREVYEISQDQLIIVTTDRISAFDVILPTPIENKGQVLNRLSLFWFDYTKDLVLNHVVSSDPKDFPTEFQVNKYENRVVLVKKLNMLPYEFIVRGYMFGSMWESYKKDGTFCDIPLREGYKLAEKLEQPILTPSIKAMEGHDEYIDMADLRKKPELSGQLVDQIENISLALYERCYKYAYERGIIIADTKFEFGIDENGMLVLADEIFTPDSSRFWSLNDYHVGTSPKSYDKQFLRDWLIENHLDGISPAPEIPSDIVCATRELYLECLERLLPID